MQQHLGAVQGHRLTLQAVAIKHLVSWQGSSLEAGSMVINTSTSTVHVLNSSAVL
jgi:hypothetical protein